MTDAPSASDRTFDFMASEHSTTRVPVRNASSWGLRTPDESPGTKALEGVVRTRFGFVLVATIDGGTLLRIVLDGWQHTRELPRGPIYSRELVTLASKFAADVHRDRSGAADASRP